MYLSNRKKYEVVSCEDCGRVFTKIAGNFCPACRELQKLQMESVIGYIKGRPGADVDEVSAALNLPRTRVLQFADEGVFRRFELSAFYPCRICQKDIDKGVICLKCNEKLNTQIESLKQAVWDNPKIMEHDTFGMPQRAPGDWGDADKLYGDSLHRKRKDREKKNRGTGWCR